ncbi:TIGR01777 family oxidoreductase [Bdellovibrio svalbardensis]|uniref:TIGR01777 family oxidoreductase n=1 Tax=Bdellovibrio svalbardensis TaxID=2972972 RepID=A0ABT6DHM7_9BACT|nr:TIGR01777 family oxidoreductase [Bdellovibrio svalbardensis]MDG0816360.1 TIGR01777 family oxidoreductase [Bdellovibrio svalbardensis]
MNILITGATGLIGKELGKALAEKGHKIFAVTRDERKARSLLPFPCEIIPGDLMKGAFKDDRMQSIEAVINLMGEPVVGLRWSSDLKKKIYDSRVLGTKHLVESLPRTVKTFVAGSAIGIYGDCGDEICEEGRGSGKDFLAALTVDWEKEAAKAPGRITFIRTGVVLSSHGGAMEQMLFPFKAGVGGILGDGKQWMSWIHINDIVGLFLFALENSQVHGPINGVAPNPVTNKEFSKTLAESLGRPLGLPVPKVAIKAMYGEAADTIVCSIRGSAKKSESLGYQFQYKELKHALDEICAPFKAGEEIFYAEQFVSIPPEELFTFFREPQNLEQITPPSLKFEIQAVSTPQIQEGTLIDYNLKIHGVPAKWKTEINEWHPPYKFVDNQLKGPYSLWHHTHEFRPFCGGTLMVDRVRYRLPMGYLGWLVAGAFVKKDVTQIFKFRKEFIAKMNLHEKEIQS